MGRREDIGGAGVDSTGVAVGLFGRGIDNDKFIGKEKGQMTGTALEEYERYAVVGLAELCARWLQDGGPAGIGAVVHELVELFQAMHEAVEQASHGDDEQNSRQRAVIAGNIRAYAFGTRPEIVEALEFLQKAEAESKKPQAANRAARRAKKR